MVRHATKDDFAIIEQMAAKLWSKSGFPKIPYKAGSATLYMQIAFDQNLLLVVEVGGEIVGAAAGSMAPMLGDSDVYIGSELAWWIEEKHRRGGAGITLLQGLEKAAKDAGCDVWCMFYMQSSMPVEVEAMYKSQGYKLKETVYMKDLKWQQSQQQQQL